MKLLNSSFCSNFPRVTSMRLFDFQDKPDPNGLFSEDIFGSTSKDKKEKYGSIFLSSKMVHPAVFIALSKAYNREIKLCLSYKPYIFENGEVKESNNIDSKDNKYGLFFFIQNISKLKRKEGFYSKQFWDLAEKYEDDIFINCLPVIPIAFRSYTSKYRYDLINDVYLMIIKISTNISNANDKNSDMFNKTYNMLQMNIQNLMNIINTKISKKSGIIRTNILGKRVDFGGRSVIVGDSKLPVDTLGVPFAMLVKLFEPFIIREMLLNNYNINESIEILQKISKFGTVKKEDYDAVKNIVNIIIKDKKVLAKRDPALHRLSWQAFKIKNVDDGVVHLNPLQTSAFNADYDGDSVVSDVELEIKIDDRTYIIKDNILNLKETKIDLERTT